MSYIKRALEQLNPNDPERARRQLLAAGITYPGQPPSRPPRRQAEELRSYRPQRARLQPSPGPAGPRRRESIEELNDLLFG